MQCTKSFIEIIFSNNRITCFKKQLLQLIILSSSARFSRIFSPLAVIFLSYNTKISFSLSLNNTDLVGFSFFSTSFINFFLFLIFIFAFLVSQLLPNSFFLIFQLHLIVFLPGLQYFSVFPKVLLFYHFHPVLY